MLAETCGNAFSGMRSFDTKIIAELFELIESSLAEKKEMLNE